MPSVKGSRTDLDKCNAPRVHSPAEGNLRAPQTAVRPSTSGGPGERPQRPRRKTNPTPSVHSQDHVHSFQSPTTSTTVLYTSDVTKEQGVIGIALGSPTSASHWTPTPQAADPNTNSSNPHLPANMLSQPNYSSPHLASQQEPAKSKLSRWKSLFRKPVTPTPQEKSTFYQLSQPAEPPPRADSHHDEEAFASQASLSPEPEREKLRNVSPPTYKPDIRSSRKWSPDEFVAPQSPSETPLAKERVMTIANSTLDRPGAQRTFATPHVPTQKSASEASPRSDASTSEIASGRPEAESKTRTPSELPLLDINLPDITMERYSVMFGNLLQSGPSRLSLLERRQANADKLKVLKDISSKDDEQNEALSLQRRATSPIVSSSPMVAASPVEKSSPIVASAPAVAPSPAMTPSPAVAPSPRLSLFPATNAGRAPSPLSGSATVRGKKELKRTRTLPAKSPNRRNFVDVPDRSERPIDGGMLKPAASPYLQPALTPTSSRSFDSDADSVTIIVAQASPGSSMPIRLHLDDREPEWEICTKPTLASNREALDALDTSVSPLTRSPSYRQPKVTKMSALCSHPSSAPLEAPSPLQRMHSMSTPPHSARQFGDAKRAEIMARRREAKLEDVAVAKATVGVARSVSVSRAKSPRAIVRTSTAPNEERVVDQLGLTPMMVEVKNRKSHRVQLDDS
ncbi:uncharacterized protein SETTUDRAFT_181102 [Exserohilum turcica Et28A]|uniref:Uncharacterized protein n=1 Tax=Exserohilum turcicum (strain 28A) TaxID=671987 RepID=R0JP66_EXST2|nr:uncharacterized protein SETTUDRAFT_181102 [Exserohilum turcica Et28A]EOA82993.1 hypothetical protein SETTUDRAFT_181102 [Exserohilum turcica Et28A]